MWLGKPNTQFGAYLETYYSFDLAMPQHAQRQPYFFNFNRHNQVNLNLGLIRLDIDHSKYRGAFAFQAGTYVNDNYINEPSSLKNIHEAYVGIALDKKSKFWIDMGILPSYIGCESAIGLQNPTLTRSLVAENSPYFMAGAQASYKGDKWTAAFILNNGWQRITRVPGSTAPGLGFQVQYHPNHKWKINLSSFAGSDSPDSLHQNRYFQNLYFQGKAGKNGRLTIGADYGIQGTNETGKTNDWYGFLLIYRHQLKNNLSLALRLEHFSDDKYVVVNQIVSDEFVVSGGSINLDFSPLNNLMLRAEFRSLIGSGPVFRKKNSYSKYNNAFTLSLAYQLN